MFRRVCPPLRPEQELLMPVEFPVFWWGTHYKTKGAGKKGSVAGRAAVALTAELRNVG